MSQRRKLIFIVLGTLCLFIVVFSFLVWSTVNECERLRELPMFPMYPQSSLMESNSDNRISDDYSLLLSILGVRSRSNLVSAGYSSDASPENIIEFYQEQAECTDYSAESGRVVCVGNAIPVGTYSVYIDLAPDLLSATNIILEIRWFGCGLSEEI